MPTLGTRPEDVTDPKASATWRPLGWGYTLLMNLGPAAIAFCAVLALAPLMARLGLPRYFSMTVAEALVLTPIELGLLLRPRTTPPAAGRCGRCRPCWPT